MRASDEDSEEVPDDNLPAADATEVSKHALRVTGERLVIAGGATGRAFAVEPFNGRTLAEWTAPTPLNGDSTFLNDHETLPDGSVVFTDSYRPYLWRGEAEGGRLEAYVYLDSAGVDYGPGFNFNGVVLGAGGTAPVAAQTNTKQLWRIDLDTRAVEEVTLDTPLESGGDGMRLGPDDRTLYVVDGGAISVYALGADARSARRTGRTTSPTFDSPTAVAFGIGADSARLYVVNSQFAARAGKEPLSLPFEVVTVGR